MPEPVPVSHRDCNDGSDRRKGAMAMRWSPALAASVVLACCAWLVDARAGDSIEPAAPEASAAATAPVTAPVDAGATEPSPEASAQPRFAVSTNVGADSWIASDFVLEVGVTPWPTPEQGTIGVRFGETDVTGLFTPVADRLRYDGGAVPLPTGQTEIVVALVGADGSWTEIGRVPLRVLTMFAGQAWESAELRPTLALGVQSQVASHTSPRPDPSTGARETFADWTLRADGSGVLRRDDFAASGVLSVQGTTHAHDTLRAPTEGDDAPRLDLADYALSLQKWGSTVTVGSFAYGTSRHLVNGFASRGATIQVPLSTIGDLTLAGGNAQSIVGWSNFTGFQESRNRVFSGTVGLGHTLAEWGSARVEGSLLEAQARPADDFNQASVTDAEESVGGSVRIIANDTESRARVDAGFTRSRFDNPSDPLLDQGLTVVPTRAAVRNAYYLDAAYDLVRDWQLTATRPVGLTVSYQGERIEPLFRSIGATTLADLEQHVVALQGSAGDISLVLSGSFAHDNLGRVRSLLTTRTRQAAAVLAVPTQSWLGTPGELEPWWPTFDYSLTWVHQYGTSLPQDGSFNESQVPDQISTVHGPGIRWAGDGFSFGYQYGVSDQNNRQQDRDRADLVNRVHTVAGSWSPAPEVTLGLDYTLESARNRELDRTDDTQRVGFLVSLVPWQDGGLAAAGSVTFGGDERDTTHTRNHDLSLELSQGYEVVEGVSSRFFVRYARVSADQRDEIFGLDQRTEGWSVNLGGSLGIL